MNCCVDCGIKGACILIIQFHPKLQWDCMLNFALIILKYSCWIYTLYQMQGII